MGESLRKEYPGSNGATRMNQRVAIFSYIMHICAEGRIDMRSLESGNPVYKPCNTGIIINSNMRMAFRQMFFQDALERCNEPNDENGFQALRSIHEILGRHSNHHFYANVVFLPIS